MTGSVSQIVPLSFHAEQAVLGAIAENPSLLHELRGQGICSEHFHVLLHSRLYYAATLLQAAGQAVDAITLSGQLREMGELEACGGIKAVVALLDQAPSSHGFPMPWVFILQESWAQRCYNQPGSTREGGEP